jgi:hypothetical protein
MNGQGPVDDQPLGEIADLEGRGRFKSAVLTAGRPLPVYADEQTIDSVTFNTSKAGPVTRANAPPTRQDCG